MTLEEPFPSERRHVTGFEDMVRHLSTRPGMWVTPATFVTVCAFLDGFDQGRDGAPLLGFKEWMVVRSNGGNNLAWFALANDLVPGQQDERRRIMGLGELIGEYLQYREDQGITKVFYDYGKWLLRKSWYRGPLRKD